MNLAIIPQFGTVIKNKKKLTLYMFARYIENLTDIFDSITVFTFEEKVEMAKCNFEIKDDKIKFKVYKGFRRKSGVIYKIFFYFLYFFKLLKALGEYDYIFLLLPGYFPITAYMALKILRRRYFCYLGGNIREVLKIIDKDNITSKIFSPIKLVISSYIIKKICRNAIFILVHGKKMFVKLKGQNRYNVYEAYSRTFFLNENIAFRDTCQNEKVVVLFVGRLSKEKGIKYLIKAVHILRKDGLPVELTIVGEGYLKSELERLIKSLEISDIVKMIGYVSDREYLKMIYKSSDIVVVPSLTEGFPKVIFEGISFLIPVIATNVGGIPYIVKNKENGLIINPKSEIEVAQSIKLIIENKELRQKIIRNEIEYVKEIELKDPRRQLIDVIKKHLFD